MSGVNAVYSVITGISNARVVSTFTYGDPEIWWYNTTQLTPAVSYTNCGSNKRPVITHTFSGSSIIGYAATGAVPKILTTTGVDDLVTTGTVISDAYTCCFYLGRLVFGSLASAYRQIYASKIGTYTDFDTSGSSSDSAWTLAVNDNVIALIPLRDTLLIMCNRSIWYVSGDPKNGGQVRLLTDRVGIIEPRAWCFGPNGKIYFVDTSGLYEMDGVSEPKNLSGDSLVGVFESISKTGSQCAAMAWDQVNHGALIVLGSTAYWWDETTRGLFLFSFSFTGRCITAYERATGNPSIGVTLMIGASDGYVYSYDWSLTTDNGTAIDWYAYLGPIRPAGDLKEAMCTALDFSLGDNPSSTFTDSDRELKYVLQEGEDPLKALVDPRQTKTGTFSGVSAVQDRTAARLSGNTFWLKVWSSTTSKIGWADRIYGTFNVGGRDDGNPGNS